MSPMAEHHRVPRFSYILALTQTRARHACTHTEACTACLRAHRRVHAHTRFRPPPPTRAEPEHGTCCGRRCGGRARRPPRTARPGQAGLHSGHASTLPLQYAGWDWAWGGVHRALFNSATWRRPRRPPAPLRIVKPDVDSPVVLGAAQHPPSHAASQCRQAAGVAQLPSRTHTLARQLTQDGRQANKPGRAGGGGGPSTGQQPRRAEWDGCGQIRQAVPGTGQQGRHGCADDGGDNADVIRLFLSHMGGAVNSAGGDGCAGGPSGNMPRAWPPRAGWSSSCIRSWELVRGRFSPISSVPFQPTHAQPCAPGPHSQETRGSMRTDRASRPHSRSTTRR